MGIRDDSCNGPVEGRSAISRIGAFLTDRRLSLAVRCVIGAVFIYAGVIKLSDPRAFARTIASYDLAPESWLPFIAVGLPLLEVIGGAGLILNIAGGLTLVTLLLFFFIFVLWYGILSGLDIDCGCFSEEEISGQASLWNAFYRDVAMLGGALYLYIVRWISSARQHVHGLWNHIKSMI